MKKFNININGYIFQMIFENEINYKNQLRYISTYIPYDKIDIDLCDEISDIDLYYFDNKNQYSNLSNQVLNSSTKKTINTFEYQTHTWSKVNGKDTFLNEKSEYVIVKESEKSFTFITNDVEKNLAYPLYIIYEILVRLEENKKALFMHGTALNYDGVGTLLLNNKGKGKTTFLVKMLEEQSTSKEFLSNDRTFLYEHDGSYRMNRFPIPVVVSGGTIKNSIALSNYMKVNKKFKRDIADIDDHKSTSSVGIEDFSKIFVSTNCVETAQLTWILIPNLRLKETGKLDIYENQETSILNETCFTPYDTESLRKVWLYQRIRSDNELLQTSNELLEKIRNEIPIYAVDFSPDVPSEEIHTGVTKVLRRR